MVSPGAVAAAGAARLTTRPVSTRLLFAVPFVLAGLAAVVLVPRAAASAPTPTQTAAPQPGIQRQYLADCAICHGADAKGTNRGPTLVGVGRASLDYYLTTGRMPITNPNRVLGNPNQDINRHPPFYAPTTITAGSEWKPNGIMSNPNRMDA